MRKTKIVATIGPASDSIEMIEELIVAGVDVFRFNMKHGDVEWHSERMRRVEEVCNKLDRRVGILIDLQGPEVRIDKVADRYSSVKKGDWVMLGLPGNEEAVTIDHPEILSELKEGQIIYADDGFLELEVRGKNGDMVEVEVIEGEVIKPRKTMNFPGMHLTFPALIEKDLENLSLAAKYEVDFVALSFVRSVDDINILRSKIDEMGLRCNIIAKIEHPDAVEHISEIVDASDGIMVARGDLGVEYPMEEVPGLQKMMVRMCREHGKPVIVATQMLESMHTNPRPTRAEVSDVANAVYDSADAVMLSGETANGMYPLRSVKMMARICKRVDDMVEIPESSIDWQKGGQTAAVVGAAYRLMDCGYKGVCDLKAFVVLTETGLTAKYLARMRPYLPIIALSNEHRTVDQLKLAWGVKPRRFDFDKREQPDIKKVLNFLKDEGLLNSGDKVIMIYGEVWGEPGLTSVIRVQAVE